MVIGEVMYTWKKCRGCLQSRTITSHTSASAEMASIRMSAMITGKPFKQEISMHAKWKAKAISLPPIISLWQKGTGNLQGLLRCHRFSSSRRLLHRAIYLFTWRPCETHRAGMIPTKLPSPQRCSSISHLKCFTFFHLVSKCEAEELFGNNESVVVYQSLV